jgi:hypothetical protein
MVSFRKFRPVAGGETERHLSEKYEQGVEVSVGHGANLTKSEYVFELMLWFGHSVMRKMVIFFCIAQFILGARYGVVNQQGSVVLAAVFFGQVVFTVLLSICASRHDGKRAGLALLRLLVDVGSSVIIVIVETQNIKAVVCVFQLLDIIAVVRERNVPDKVLVAVQMLAKVGWIILLFLEIARGLAALVAVTIVASFALLCLKIYRRCQATSITPF